MTPPDKTEITRLLKEVRSGNRNAANQLAERLNGEMRRIAAYYMKAERPGHTLQPTALVNEAFIRVFGGEQVDWQDRAHFIAACSRHMRNILVDHARRKSAGKRGSGAIQVTLSAADGVHGMQPDVEALNEALTVLEKSFPGPARVVELKFFGGLTDEEVAEVSGNSFAQVRRDWQFARAWLFHRLKA
jgi:RNA polymerase sigma factor (TIGR02999 family)